VRGEGAKHVLVEPGRVHAVGIRGRRAIYALGQVMHALGRSCAGSPLA
jgi:hypothetical protein